MTTSTKQIWIVTEVSRTGGVSVKEPFRGAFETRADALIKAADICGFEYKDGFWWDKSGEDRNFDDYVTYPAPGSSNKVRYYLPRDKQNVTLRAEPDIYVRVECQTVKPFSGHTIQITDEQLTMLKDKLERLVKECLYGGGVDIWLAPGGYCNVNKHPDHDDVFMTPEPDDGGIIGELLDSLKWQTEPME